MPSWGINANHCQLVAEFPQESAQLFTDKSDDKQLEALSQEGVKFGIGNIMVILDKQVTVTKSLKDLVNR